MLNLDNGKSTFDCAVIGNWHLAFVTAACLSKLGHSIVLVNSDTPGDDDFPSAPVYEPGLPELLEAGKRSGRLKYCEGVAGHWNAKYVWLAIDTPVNERDEVDLEPLRVVISQLVEYRKPSSGVLIVNSQIPLGFCDSIQQECGLRVVYIPENLRLGQGIETFLKADRTVIGSNKSDLREEIQGFLSGINTEFLLCDLATAEMIKHATNAFLATSISFSNELARIGEKFGVNNQLVGNALRMDKRIGKKAYVVPGLGFAGGTLPRDLRVLQMLGRKTHTPTPIMDAVFNVNESTTQAVSESVLGHFNGEVTGKRILILGYTYKAETNTLRRSFSVTLADYFLGLGSQVWGFDPFMNDADLNEFSSGFQHFSAWRDIPFCPDIVILMTARPEFKFLDWQLLKQKGGQLNPLIVDVRGGLEGTEILRNGFSYKSLWQPVLRPNEGEGMEV